MIINKYFHPLKKTGPPVETGRPLRLLDMRIFNFLCCAETPAYNGKTHLINKHIFLLHAKPINL
jgi:hypothetical protein